MPFQKPPVESAKKRESLTVMPFGKSLSKYSQCRDSHTILGSLTQNAAAVHDSHAFWETSLKTQAPGCDGHTMQRSHAQNAAPVNDNHAFWELLKLPNSTFST